MVVRRLALLIAAAAVVLALYTLRLIFLQLVHGEEFAARATSTTEYRFNVTAARGDIVDSAGRRIATSTTCYNVELSRLLIGDNDLNETIRSAVEILQANGESWNDTLLIGYADGAGHYAFTGDADSTSDQNAIARVKEALGLQQYATADDVMDRLIEEYELEGYDPVWQRILGGIHYQMEQEAFSNVNNFVLAEDRRRDRRDQRAQLHRRHHPAPCAGPGGQDHRRDVAGHRRKRPDHLPFAGPRLRHERRHRHFGPGVGL